MNYPAVSHFSRNPYVLSTGTLLQTLCVLVILCNTFLLLEWVFDKSDSCYVDK